MIDIKKARRIPKNADLSRIHPDLRDKAVPCSLLTAHPDNPRVHLEANKRAIAGSLKRFQQRNLIVVNRTDAGLRIEAHHEVFRQMLELGSEYVAVAIMEDDPITEMGFLLADNRTGDLSEDDPARLAPILKQLIEAGEDVEEIGWDDESVKALLEEPSTSGGGTDPEPQVDRAEELREQWGTAAGQLWEIPSKTVPGRCHRVLCGDCRKPEDVARLMDGQEAAAVLTDPPYGINQPGVPHDSPEELQSIVEGSVKNLPVKNAVVVAFQSTRTFPQWLDAIRANGHTFERMLWLYKAAQCTFPWRGWILTSESILVSTVGKGQWQDVHPFAHDCYYLAEVSGELDENSGWHGSVKPITVVADIVKRICPNGGNVFDPFLGSGTTAIAAEREGRIGYGIEISPKYLAVILQRAKDAGMAPRLADV